MAEHYPHVNVYHHQAKTSTGKKCFNNIKRRNVEGKKDANNKNYRL